MKAWRNVCLTLAFACGLTCWWTITQVIDMARTVNNSDRWFWLWLLFAGPCFAGFIFLRFGLWCARALGSGPPLPLPILLGQGLHLAHGVVQVEHYWILVASSVGHRSIAYSYFCLEEPTVKRHQRFTLFINRKTGQLCFRIITTPTMKWRTARELLN